MGRFDSVALTDEQARLAQALRADFETIGDLVVENVPEGRERSLALTKLEEAAMWAIKGISRG